MGGAELDVSTDGGKTFIPITAATFQVKRCFQVQQQGQQVASDPANARPVEQKKGADKGIDGRIFFHDEGETAKTKQIVLSVKAGKLHAPYVRDLRGVVEREQASMGVLITMEQPTKPMRTEAASAGFYESPAWNTKHPRIQIVTVGELLAGKAIDAPPSKDFRTFKKAPRVKKSSTEKQGKMFKDEEE
jgi:Restriction endonuclease